jgi:hypothetical protein
VEANFAAASLPAAEMVTLSAVVLLADDVAVEDDDSRLVDDTVRWAAK